MDIIIRDTSGVAHAFTPTTEGYHAAQRKIYQLGQSGTLNVQGSDINRVLDVTQPSHRQTGPLRNLPPYMR